MIEPRVGATVDSREVPGDLRHSKERLDGDDPPRAASLLVVEDDAATARLIERILEREGYRVTVARDRHAGISALTGGRHDLVITDLWLDGEPSGGTFVDEIRSLPAQTPILLVTGAPLEQTSVITATHPDVTVLSKPFRVIELSGLVRELLASRP